MLGSIRVALWFAAVLPAFAQQDHSGRIFETFTGRFHCNGQWNDFQFKMSLGVGLLGIVDPDEPAIGRMQFYFYRSVTSTDGATYILKGPLDTKTGHFRMEPLRWATPHPAVFEMIGVEGTYDVEARKMLSVKMLSDKCDAVEMVPPGGKLAPLPGGSALQPAANRSVNNARPERRISPSNVTVYLDPASYSPDFEYWVTAWSDPPGAVHEGAPIDESVERMKKEKFACAGSVRVNWDAGGMKGTAPDQVRVTERFVVECVGDCKGVFYRPYVGANVTHFGLSAPLPTMQIKSMSLGGASFRWNFSRTNRSSPPPEVWIHRWAPTVGFGPFDPAPAEVQRRIASAPPCRAPQTNR
jgi:hypothetical protein